MRWPSSLRSRLTLWYTVFVSLPLVLLAVVTYIAFAGALQERTDRFIAEALTAFSRELLAERRATLSAEQAIRSTIEEVRFRDLTIAVTTSGGSLVAMTEPAPGSEAGRVRTIERTIQLGGHDYHVAGAYPMRDSEIVLARIRRMFLFAIPLLVLVAATSGYALARRSLAPVASMAARAADISATNMHERLPVGGGDELVRLASVVNALLDRLELAFAQQRRFVADASHELRTPTAILRTEADVTLSREHRSEEEYRASVSVMKDAAQRLTRVVDDLFLLARADAGHLVMHAEPLYLEELVHGATRAVRSVAEQRGVSIALGEVIEAPFQGDPDLLGRLLLNLLDNAIKYSPRGGAVRAAMARDAHAYSITVTDTGPGIPASEQEHVFERFFRGDIARSRSEATATSGAGLGLAIARRIAEMHHGTLVLVESRAGHTEFRLALPSPASG
ncbi:MAG: hypothetical protein JWO05_859 [Gemmatimonadetes bacterium]|nr:hypothetical protein [Gemmatimonadota bacterium]